jgi:hypothetical protein
MRHQCEKIGVSFDDLSPDEAARLLPALERFLEGFVVRPKDLETTMHELKVEIGGERFALAKAPSPQAPARGRGARPVQPPGG